MVSAGSRMCSEMTQANWMRESSKASTGCAGVELGGRESGLRDAPLPAVAPMWPRRAVLRRAGAQPVVGGRRHGHAACAVAPVEHPCAFGVAHGDLHGHGAFALRPGVSASRVWGSAQAAYEWAQPQPAGTTATADHRSMGHRVPCERWCALSRCALGRRLLPGVTQGRRSGGAFNTWRWPIGRISAEPASCWVRTVPQRPGHDFGGSGSWNASNSPGRCPAAQAETPAGVR
jgi:hypothetical protein